MAQRQRQRSSEPYFRKIDFVFYNEGKIRVAVAEMRLDDGRPRIPQKIELSDPTTSQALRNLTPIKSVVLNCEQSLEYPERWLIVIDKTWQWAKSQDDCRYEVARRRYSHEDYRQTCRELQIANSTRRRLLDYFRMYASLHAVQLGLIRV